MKNQFENRLALLGRTTKFGQLHNGDAFIAQGLNEEPKEKRVFRKMYGRPEKNAIRLQCGTWETFPAEWPVVLVDTVIAV